MKKSLMNIKNFVDTNVRNYRIDKSTQNPTSSNSLLLSEDFSGLEKQFENLRQVCGEAEKRISALLPSLQTSSFSTYYQNAQASLNNLSNLATNSSDTNIKGHSPTPSSTNKQDLMSQKHNKKLPQIALYKFISKFCDRFKPDSLVGNTLSQCATLQSQLNSVHMSYEVNVEETCLQPLRQILESDVPNIIKLKKFLMKASSDLEHARNKYNTSQAAKLDQSKKDLDDASSRYEQAKENYAIELYAFVSREPELVRLFNNFYEIQANYHSKVANLLNGSLPYLRNILVHTNRKPAFGTSLEEHLECTGHKISVVINVSIHFLYLHAMKEEGLFRVSGSLTKVKRLKNALNAWFITKSKQNDVILSSNSPTSNNCEDFCVHSVQNLFKDILSQKRTVSAINEYSFISRDNELVDTLYDVHSIASLLKLFLRELPEPLICQSLYKEWIEAACRPISDGQRLSAFAAVVKKLPESNYNNLKHLIKFLKLFSSYQDVNKMTPTNLAIAIAPSLIRAPSNAPIDVECVKENQSLEMTSAGMSASLHTLIVDSLITNADTLMPEHSDYEIKVSQPAVNSAARRIQATGSPSAMSTASSTSFVSSTDESSDTSPSVSPSTSALALEISSTRAKPQENETKSEIPPPRLNRRKNNSFGKPLPPPPPVPEPTAQNVSPKDIDNTLDENVKKLHVAEASQKNRSEILNEKPTVIDKVGNVSVNSTCDTAEDHSPRFPTEQQVISRQQSIRKSCNLRPNVPPPSLPCKKEGIKTDESQ